MNFVSYPTSEAKPVTGKVIAEKLKRMRPGARAVFALDLFSSNVPITGLSREQVAGLTGVSAYSIALTAIATEAEREALQTGFMTLADVRLAHARTPDEMHESLVRAIINYVGFDRLWAVLDAMTAPPVPTPTIDPMTSPVLSAAAE